MIWDFPEDLLFDLKMWKESKWVTVNESLSKMTQTWKQITYVFIFINSTFYVLHVSECVFFLPPSSSSSSSSFCFTLADPILIGKCLVWFLLKLFSSSSESGTHNHLWNGACWLTPSTRACNSISCLHVCFHSLFLVCSWRFIYIYFCGKETQKVAQQVIKFAINISLNCRNNAVMTTMTRDGCSGATGC